jgi:hypothetical protein
VVAARDRYAWTIQGGALLASGTTATGRCILAGDLGAMAGTLSLALPALSPATPWGITGFATVNLLGTAQADTLTIAGLTGGWIGTGAGNDAVTLTEFGAGALALDAGLGDDSIMIRGHGRGTAVVSLGAGADRLNISGMASATIDGGGGSDLIVVTMDGNYRVIGGDGPDGLIIAARLSGLTFGRGAEGTILVRSGSATVTVSGIESFRSATAMCSPWIRCSGAPAPSPSSRHPRRRTSRRRWSPRRSGPA